MSNGWTWDDFGPDQYGLQFQWLNERLTLHGYPATSALQTIKQRVQAFQLGLGFKGTQPGGNADGWVGPVTLRYLKAPPRVPKPSGIDTTPWKWTGPTGEPGHPDEVYPINGFQVDPWFVQRNGHLIFRSNAGGVKTGNSVHARSEFREMDGDEKAKWDTNDGRDHTLFGELAITALPPHIPIVVFGQCHDLLDDVFMLAAVGSQEDDERFDVQIWRSLGKNQGNKKEPVLRDVRLNSFFNYQMLFTEAGFFLEINGVKVYEYGGAWEDCYWKAGCYPQTNVAKGEKPNAYGEVDYAGLLLGHAA